MIKINAPYITKYFLWKQNKLETRKALINWGMAKQTTAHECNRIPKYRKAGKFFHELMPCEVNMREKQISTQDVYNVNANYHKTPGNEGYKITSDNIKEGI